MRKRIKTEQSKHEIYKRNFKRVLQSIIDESFKNKDDAVTSFRKAVFYGVKIVVTYPKDEYLTREKLRERFEEAEVVKMLIEFLSPIELMQVFPVDKQYGGSKYETKDYFSTMEMLNKLDINTSFRNQKADINMILMGYENIFITVFMLEIVNMIDGFRKLEGKESMVVEFMREQGVHPMTMYTDEATGKKFLIDENGKTIPIKEKKDTGLLRVVK